MDPVDAPGDAHEALLQFLYQAPIGLVQAQRDGQITMINPRSVQLLMPLVPNGHLLNLFDVLDPVAPQLRALAAAPGPTTGTLCEALRLPLPDGAEALSRTLSLNLLRLNATTLIASLTDVTLEVEQERQRLDASVRDAMRTDRLTAMPTRAVALERIQAVLDRAPSCPDDEFAVLFVNADRFDRINLTLGQAGGDEVLQQMAGRLGAALRPRDAVARSSLAPAGGEPTAARLGGDEFVVVLEGLRHADDALGVAQRLCDLLARPYRVGGAEVHGSASIGVVTRGQAAARADAVLQDAGIAMREAKRGGGARCCRFEPAMKQRAWRRGQLEAELRLALARQELFVVYQPIVSLADGATAGVEALVRWQHPRRGLVPPIEFIEIAEETGLIGALGEFVLGAACRQFVDWQAALGAAAPKVLSVNLSRAQLLEPDIAAQVQRALRASGLAPGCLQLEVTESLAAQDQLVQGRLQELKALGLQLALDDFGTGYSSLASLHLLPLDVVKIDRSFVSQAEFSAHHRVLIEATVRVARSLGLRTVAEGIETEGQAAVLASLHCDKGQGYLYARPLPAAQVADWLTRRRQSLPALGALAAS